jgi:hypothetical protein
VAKYADKGNSSPPLFLEPFQLHGREFVPAAVIDPRSPSVRLAFGMATLSQLVDAIATVEGLDRERVGAIARAVREAELIATHGRGTSAAHMGVADAANLLIAVNAAETARSAPEIVRRYRASRTSNKKQLEFGPTFEGMIAAAGTRRLADHLMDLGFGPAGDLREKLGHAREKFDLRIEFLGSRPLVVIECRIPISAMPKPLPFYPRDSTARAQADRRISISHRTIHAIAENLGV